MKKKSQVLALFILLLLIIAFACKKDENEEIIDIITSKAWKFGLTDLNTHTNPAGNNSYYAVLECEKDDTFTFKTDGTMVRTFNSKKCDGDVGAFKTVNYSFNKDTRELTIDGVKYAVTEENKSQLKYVLVTPAATGANNRIYLLQ